MKTTVTRRDFHREFAEYGRSENFSSEALDLLFDYLEGIEEECGFEIEFNPIQLCCEYSEMGVLDLIADYGIDVSDVDPDDEEAKRDLVHEYLWERTGVAGETSEGNFVFATF